MNDRFTQLRRPSRGVGKVSSIGPAGSLSTRRFASSGAHSTIGSARADECSGVFSTSASSRGRHIDLSPCAKYPIPPREQAMTMPVSGRDEHHVMKAITGEPGVAMGNYFSTLENHIDLRRLPGGAEGIVRREIGKE